MPFDAIDLGLGDLVSLARLAALPFFVACLLSWRLCFGRPSAPVWWFGAYLAVAAVALLVARPELRRQAVSPFLTVLQLVVFFWIVSRLFRNQKFAEQALRLFAIGVVALSLATLAEIPGFSGSYETKESAVARRITALDYGSNDLAAVVALGAVVLLSNVVSTKLKGRYRLLSGAIAIPLVMLVVRTGSRAGVVALLAGLSVFLLPAPGTRRRLVTVFVGAAVLLGVVVMVITDPLLEARFGSTYYYGDTSGHTRIYGAALEMISERPLTGWGPVTGLNELGERLQYRVPGGRYLVRDAHNLVLHLLLEVGIIGTVPFLIGLLLVSKAAWRGRKGSLGLAPLALLVVVLTTSIAHTFYHRKPMWLVMAIATASATSRKVRCTPLRLPHLAARRERRQTTVRGTRSV